MPKMLACRVAVSHGHAKGISSRFVPALQAAVVHFNLTEIDHLKEDEDISALRIVEPFALLITQNNWLLLAWRTMRRGFRFSMFVDRMKRIEVLE